MSYEPREFWEQRLRQQFDLRGTGETELSLAYNRACYALRREVLERALDRARIETRGAAVLDVGCGTGFFTQLYLDRGARVTGVDITSASVEQLSARFPQARFVQADVSISVPDEPFDIVNVFDVLYHITDDAAWERAVRNLARAVAPGGALLITDVFSSRNAEAEHNVGRPLERYRALLEAEGLTLAPLEPTHVLLNQELGPFRPLNRAPGLLLLLDRALLRLGFGRGPLHNKLLVARRPK